MSTTICLYLYQYTTILGKIKKNWYKNIKIKILTNSFLNCKWSYSILVCITFSGLETGNSARSLE